MFWIIYGTICLSLIIAFRFSIDLKNLINEWRTGYEYVESIYISKVFMLDLCPAFCFLLHPVVIINPNRKIALYIAPCSLFGGLLTITGGIAFDPQASWTIQYIFFGISPNEAYFLIHFLNAFTGMLILLNTPNDSWKTCLWTLAVLAFYFLYICLVMICFNGKITDHVTGLLPADWLPGGEYEAVMDILKISWEWCMVILAIGGLLIIEALHWFEYGLQKTKWWNISKKKSNKNILLGYYQTPNLFIRK